MVTQVKSSNIAVGAITTDQIAAGAITVADIPDGEITAAKLHTTLDLSSKTITYPTNSVTADALHTTAVTDKLGYTPVAPNDSPTFSGLTVDTDTLYVDSANNRVGIGTSSPAYKLDVSGSARTTSNITASRNGLNPSFISQGFYGFAVRNSGTDWAAIAFQTNDGSSNYARIGYWDSGSLRFETNGTEAAVIDNNQNFKFNSGYGSVATAYAARAWVNFNGTGTVAINNSANVSSITDGGTGDYRINFTTAMPDENYTAAGICRESSSGTDGMIRLSSIYTVNTIRVLCLQNTANTVIDCEKVVLTVFR